MLGIDIGFSTRARSSAVCRLSWKNRQFGWHIERFRYEPEERTQTIKRVAGGKRLLAAAFDGPMRGSLDVIGRYRIAERLLTRKLQSHIGKPGQSSSPVGKQLNKATNEAARFVLSLKLVDEATHEQRIHPKAIVEAFPTSFMGLMLEDAKNFAGKRARNSDRFFSMLVERKGFEHLLDHLHPGAAFSGEVAELTNHDDRAAFICARDALGSISDLASLHSLSSYDAAYLELAIRLQIPLATLDNKLAAAATSCGIDVLPHPA